MIISELIQILVNLSPEKEVFTGDCKDSIYLYEESYKVLIIDCYSEKGSMTVAQMIEQLSKMDLDKDIMLCDNDSESIDVEEDEYDVFLY